MSLSCKRDISCFCWSGLIVVKHLHHLWEHVNLSGHVYVHYNGKSHLYLVIEIIWCDWINPSFLSGNGLIFCRVKYFYFLLFILIWIIVEDINIFWSLAIMQTLFVCFFLHVIWIRYYRLRAPAISLLCNIAGLFSVLEA